MDPDELRRLYGSALKQGRQKLSGHKKWQSNKFIVSNGPNRRPERERR